MSYRPPPRSRPPPPPPPPLHQENIHVNEASNAPFHPYHPPQAVRSFYRNSYEAGETVLSDDASTYYEYYNDCRPHRHPSGYDAAVLYSEDSGSTRLPLYESDDGRNNFGYAENNVRKSQLYGRGGAKSSTSSNAGAARDFRRIYPNAEEVNWSRMYQEINNANNSPPSQHTIRTFPNRPQSSLSSAVGSTIVDGCGGKCQTCENVCYFFLQLVFTMGILIGISLCIAGTVLRKSAARNLQVLVYIGVLVSLVSALLLGIQCNARKHAKNRKKAIWTSKRAPIPLDTLNVQVQNQPLMENRTQRILPQIEHSQRNFVDGSVVDEQGIPWWRRKDLRK